MVGFLQPWMLLAAAGAAGAAVLIHFLSRKKSRLELPFTNLSLVEEILSKRRRMKNIQDVLLAALRALAALLIVATAARPYLHWNAAEAAAVEAADTFWMAFDISYSMDWRQPDGTALLERSKEAARGLLREIRRTNARARIGILAFSDKIHRDLSLEPSGDSGQIERAIAALRILSRPTRQEAWVEELRRDTERSAGVFVFSDFSANGFSGANPRPLSFPVILVNAREEETGNRRIHARYQSGSKSISAAVICHGISQKEPGIRIQISDPETQAVLSTAIAPGCGKIDIPLASETVRRLEMNQEASIRISIPTDRLPLDDSQEMVLLPGARVNALVVDGEPGRRLNESESFYLRQALKAHSPSGWTVISQQEFSEALKKNPDYLGAAETLWMLHPQKIDSRSLQALENFLSNPSKKAVFSLGPQADTAALESLLGVRFRPYRPVSGSKVSIQSPAQGFWLGSNTSAQMAEFEMDSITISMAADSEAGEEAKIWLKAGDIPLLWEPPRRGARVFVFSSTLDTQWNNMAHKGFFQAMIAALAEEPALVRIPSQADWGEEISILAPDSTWKQLKLISPSRETVRARVLGRKTAWGPLEELGFYELEWPSIRPPGAPARIASALPEAASESDLSPASARNKAALLGDGFWREMPLREALASPRKAVSMLSARHLWRPMFLGAFLLLGAESLLSLFFSRKKK